MSIVGLDIGTTGAKATAFRLNGEIVASAYREYNMASPEPGQLELVPGEVLAAIRAVLGELTSKTRSDPPQSLAWSVLGEAMVPIDQAGRALGNAIIGFDCRGEEEADYLRGELTPEEAFRITGHPVNSYHSICKLLWWRTHRPEVFKQARKWLCFADYFVHSLGLPPAIDYALASRMLFLDVKNYTWSERMLALAGITAEHLAAPTAPGDAIGEIGRNDFGFPETAFNLRKPPDHRCLVNSKGLRSIRALDQLD